MSLTYEELQPLRREANKKGKTPATRQKYFEESLKALKDKKSGKTVVEKAKDLLS